MVSANSGLCLDVVGVSKTPGALLQQWPCWGGSNQAWKVVDVGQGASQLVSVNSGLALDVVGVSTTQGAYMQQWPYWGGANQQWLIQSVDDQGNPTPSGASASSAGSSDDGASVGCGRPQGQITLGGVAGVQSLVDATSTAQYRSCGGGLYIHQVGWGTLTDQDRRQVAANFASTGPVHLEMAEATNLASDYMQFGITAISTINVNAASCDVPAVDESVASWQGWVASYKAANVGFQWAQYNDTPNCPSGPLDWNSSTWDDSRARAMAGGGVILDAPPSLYEQVLGDTYNYKQFVKDEIAWANANGLHSTVIISALDGNFDFLADTQAMVAEFNALPANQRPQEYACENYGAGASIGSENDAGSVANLALWLVQNASTYTP